MGGGVDLSTNNTNSKPFELLLELTAHRAEPSIIHPDLNPTLVSVQLDAEGREFDEAEYTPYRQAQADTPTFSTTAPKLLRFPSFDALDIAVLYYRLAGAQAALPALDSGSRRAGVAGDTI